MINVGRSGHDAMLILVIHLFFDAQYPLTSKNSPPTLPAIESNVLLNVSLFVDLERAQVLFATDGKDAGTVEALTADLAGAPRTVCAGDRGGL
jgi:hypothetical protein